ncbi:MAG: ATP-binding cassette domain-containing protein [Eubacteriales bacterium]|nr:ATP-binding cassette domain-containing protein [Eubacteriales bacterium]
MSLLVDVEKDFGGFVLSASFEAGQEVMGILGASGCGKSMTLRCIAGIVTPDRGRIVLNGETLFDSERGINLPPQKRRVGLLFQNYALFPNMTVEQNLRTGLYRARKDKGRISGEEERAIAGMMEKFFLTGLEKHRPFQLSGGQQQRVALARILLTRPGLLMLDEPFSALDGYLRWNLELELSELLKEFGGTTLFVSHSRDEVYRICDRICVMEKGRSTPAAPVKEMFEEPRTLAACMLSGCKNYSEAERQEKPGWIYARDWEQAFDCGRPVEADITDIGVRSHFIHVLSPTEAKNAKNVMPCRILRIVEDVFSQVIIVKPQAVLDREGKRLAEQNTSLLRLEMTKEAWKAYAAGTPAGEGDPILVQIDGRDILLLRR